MSRTDRALAADVGGTKIRLAVVSETAEGLRIEEEHLLLSDPERLLRDLINDVLSVDLRRDLPAVFAVAGPVSAQRVRLTNLPWVFSAEELGGELQLGELQLINDVEAMAWSLEDLRDFQEIKTGKMDPEGHRAVLSLGTGLGEGGAVYAEGRYHPWAGEGGHCDWAPTEELEWELAQFLRGRLGLKHLSRERLLSGEGLVNIARFIFAREGKDLEKFLQGGEAEAVVQVHRAAREGSDAGCVRALDFFMRLLGAEAGNLAMVCGAMGGVFLGGGMAVKLGWALGGESFREAFLAKARMRRLLEEIPVMLIPDERAPLLGAARCAFRRLDADRA